MRPPPPPPPNGGWGDAAARQGALGPDGGQGQRGLGLPLEFGPCPRATPSPPGLRASIPPSPAPAAWQGPWGGGRVRDRGLWSGPVGVEAGRPSRSPVFFPLPPSLLPPALECQRDGGDPGVTDAGGPAAEPEGLAWQGSWHVLVGPRDAPSLGSSEACAPLSEGADRSPPPPPSLPLLK